MTAQSHSDRSNIEAIARTIAGDHEIRRSDGGVFIKPSRLDGDGEFSVSLEELGDAFRLLGYNRADLFPEG